MRTGFLLRRAFAGAVSGLAALFVLQLLVSTTHAAELKVLSGNGMRTILGSIIDDFERSTGHKLQIDYNTAGLMRDRIRAGEIADVAIMQRYLLNELLDQGKIVRGSAVDIARSVIGVFGRTGGPKPDISSIEALKRVLLQAESITYTDPANGGLSGTQFAKVLEQLGIVEQMKRKTKLGRPGPRVVSGEVELGILQISEILPLEGIQLIGRLPVELQDNTPVSAAIISGAQRPEAGMALINFLSSPVATNAIRTHGMEPANQK
jgi:molybdate transport system substrate-binding protein